MSQSFSCEIPTYNKSNFETFVQKIKAHIESTFTVESEQFSKSLRNIPGIIASVNKKEYYFKQWKKSTTKDNVLGEETLYCIYKEFRKKLKHIIKAA